MGKWKLIVDVDARTWRHDGIALYNLEDDPGETKNRAMEYPDKIKKLRERLNVFELELSEIKRLVGRL